MTDQNQHDEYPSPILPPGLMFRSFLTVASGYVLVILGIAVSSYLLGLLWFPEYLEFFNMEVADQEKFMEENPQGAISKPMFAGMVVVNFIVCVGVGWLTTRTAPFAHFPHAVVLAVLVFAFFLQIVIGDHPDKKWMDVVYMGALPIAILMGAKWRVDRSQRFTDVPEESRDSL